MLWLRWQYKFNDIRNKISWFNQKLDQIAININAIKSNKINETFIAK